MSQTDLVERVWPLGSYAPGRYMCKCLDCTKMFEGDKRALSCLECAVKSANFRVATLKAKLDEQAAELASLRAELEQFRREAVAPIDRDTLGRMVREAWVRWAVTQPSPKPSWLVPYDGLSEPDKEADRQIGEAIAKWTVIHLDAARAFVEKHQNGGTPND